MYMYLIIIVPCQEKVGFQSGMTQTDLLSYRAKKKSGRLEPKSAKNNSAIQTAQMWRLICTLLFLYDLCMFSLNKDQ